MKTLVTGGAGFIGSHVVPRLLEMGREIVVLDSLEEQVHGGREPDLPDDVRFIHGDVGDPQAAARALEGVDEVVHLAAVVGVGQSMYEIDRYTRSNTMATAIFLEQVVARKIPPSRLVVASSMSIYGEGEYECDDHGGVAPAPAARGAAPRSPVGGPSVRNVVRRSVRWHRRGEAVIPTSIYAITKRDHEELCLVTGRPTGSPRWRCASSTSTALGRRCLTHTPGWPRSSPSRLMNGMPAADFRGRATVARLHSRQRHRRRRSSPAPSSPGG